MLTGVVTALVIAVVLMWVRLDDLGRRAASASFVVGLDHSTARCFDERDARIDELERRIAEIEQSHRRRFG
jgi:hypothetical protein